jgi:hypothetical protein
MDDKKLHFHYYMLYVFNRGSTAADAARNIFALRTTRKPLTTSRVAVSSPRFVPEIPALPINLFGSTSQA